MDAFKPLIAKVAAGAPLSASEAENAFERILSGESTPAQTGAFLMALRVRGETVDEITGAVRAMRGKMLPVETDAAAIDIVGTGGDNVGTWNVSTLAAILVAACGVKVAKHGNRAASSKSGAADVLTALNVKVGLTPEHVARCIDEAGVGFMMAPNHHASMRHVGPVRTELGTRTIFNLLGPLSNPASVKRQVVGVFSPGWLEPIAETLRTLGSDRVWVVHGADGLDELTTTGPTHVVELKDGKLARFDVSPADAGLKLSTMDDLRGGEPAVNAIALKGVLQGAKNAYRDIAVLNAAAGLVVAGKAGTLADGARMAEAAIDSGKAAETLARLVTISNG
ncbi:MAG: anthranilate phosphoribosyltransferase [Methylocystis sp.]|nr:anthranilate phosphoribosyltransferase [Methylocystis sp.]MCA3586225.1 anthranilate phosphoribosyltransferase [Methylocystis sp.]MCA3587444.1 anthranilate phosphoribosyltransferase [Methylocystis sp.]MCA3592701.1 anthranilate phosphoribosyltransferase [Methylocystis sp.]